MAFIKISKNIATTDNGDALLLEVLDSSELIAAADPVTEKKDGVTYVMKNGEWVPLEDVLTALGVEHQPENQD